MESMTAPTAPVTIGVDTHLELHVAGVDDAEHDGHHQQEVGDGRRSRGPFVGDEPVVQDIVGTGSQRAKDADGHENSRGELDRLPAGDRVTSTSRRDLSAAAVRMAVATITPMALVPRMPAWRRPGPGGPPGLQNRCEQRPCSGGFDSRPPPLSRHDVVQGPARLLDLLAFMNSSIAQDCASVCAKTQQDR